MPGKYEPSEVVELVGRALAREFALIEKFEKLQKETGRLAYYKPSPTPPIPIRGDNERRCLCAIGSRALKAVQANMEDIQHNIELLQNNESGSEYQFRKLVEEMKL